MTNIHQRKEKNLTHNLIPINIPTNNELNKLTIATHNVQGLNDPLKFQTWIEYCNEKNYNIISMTETKIAESKYNKLQFTNPYYHIYTSNCNKIIAKKQESSMGTAIAISRPLQPYIHNIQTEPGTAILIDLFFPQNQRLRIISVYLPSNNASLNLQTQKKITNWISYAITHNLEIIILGDFNSDANKHNKPTLQLFNTMNTRNIKSLLKYFNINAPTWARSSSNSQIDDIWVSSTLIPTISTLELNTAELITDSDHKIIQVEWQPKTYIQKYRTKKNTRQIFSYHKMT